MCGCCIQFPGYDIEFGWDHWGDDIVRVANVAAAYANCTANPECAGFNTDGWTKYFATPTAAATTRKCIWRKSSTVCPIIAGYWMTPNLLRKAPFISNSTRRNVLGSSGASGLCNANKNCWAISSDGRYWGAVDTSYNETVPGMCWYDRIPSCLAFDGYTSFLDRDHFGDTLYGISATPADAAEACWADPNCGGFNGLGERKMYNNPTVNAVGVCFYRKNVTACPPLPGYTVSRGVLRQGTIINTASDVTHPVEGARVQCNDDSDCKGFGTDMTLLSEYTGAPIASATDCFYEKLPSPPPPPLRVADGNCLPGVWFAGDAVGSPITSATKEECRLACDRNPSCTFSIRMSDAEGTCYLRRNVFEGGNGDSYVEELVDQVCWRRNATGDYTADPNCIARIDMNGDDLTSYVGLDRAACQAACAVHPRCYLKASPFAGNAGVTTYMPTTIDQLCWKGPAPSPPPPPPPPVKVADGNCLPGVWFAGDAVGSPITSATKEECRLACDRNPSCTFSIRMSDAEGTCYLRSNVFEGGNGISVVTPLVDQVCWRRNATGDYTADPNCIARIDMNGDDLASYVGLDRAACKAACATHPRLAQH
ncbi:hypothetical protein GPECTOR_47g383 [Gonium pectorale]|uniref:Apple domain-containing protein n=1 Tax=Gonium pectorale TaxID=33097 RepID=A0A150G8B8_GONPE|nr:hypothetical protein GPECTOR_47g383 [Gonium pectorale]|eukprot:KXZ46106.1 hypothetical protein GPECTOR_47g383 [Gonium pectorale]